MNTEFISFDKSDAALRVLWTIAYYYKSITRSELIEDVKPLGVARTALYSALTLLNDLGLIKEEHSHREGIRVKLTSLTDKGLEVAKKVIEIEKIFESKEES